MAEQFPPLSAATLAAANQVGAWLAQDDLAAAQAVPLLISGGVGHSTGYLYEAVRQDPRYRTLPVDGRPEAHVLADIAHDYWHIPHSRLVVEDQSTNCGENARFTRTTLESRGSPIVAGSSFRTRLCSGEPWLPSPASGRGRRRRSG
ncbi:protein ydcF [Klebsiella pneumoniae]|uniref:Protein ydcF n=1 Tax=Klebsiella pneumoniae TaxID=573 RepID=A0A378F3U9_KLEPN|nr:protein ydcF [Klebsiella pneumoniae]